MQQAIYLRQQTAGWIKVHAYVWSVAIVTIMTAGIWLLQHVLGVPNLSITPLYLVAVLFCAMTSGRWPAMLCASLSFVAFKFFFVPPIYTLTVKDAEDVPRMLIFLATAFLAGGMAIRVREQATAAQQRADEAAALYDLSQAISTQLNFNAIAPLIVRTTMRLLSSPGCRILLTLPDGTLSETAQGGQWLEHAVIDEAPLRTSQQTLGALQVIRMPQPPVLAADRQRLLETLANQAALALERSRLAQAAAQAEALAASDRLKSTLLATVSHDVRTPLASIMAAADELITEDIVWSSAASRDFAQVIHAQAQRLNHLMTNLLDLSRIEAGVVRPQRGWYNVAEIIYTVLERSAPDLAERPIELIVADDLPLIPVDYVHLEQVLWNILQNALKYSPSTAPITIAVAVQDQALLFHIGDRGRGIAPEQRTRVFEKFYRLPQRSGEQIAGTGIGLAICKGLIDANGGHIRILGREGGGTLVEIWLPLQEIESAVLVGV